MNPKNPPSTPARADLIPTNIDPASIDSSTLADSSPQSLGLPIESMQWRIDNFRREPEPDPGAVTEALDTTLEELRVAVDQLRETNDALRGSRADVEMERSKYRDLFESSPDAYLVTDLLGVIREANRATSALLGIDNPEFIVGKPLVVFLADEGRPSFRVELIRLGELVEPREFEIRLTPRKRAAIDASARVAVIRDLFGKATGLRWTIRDVTAWKKAEETIKALNDQLERRVVDRSEQLESVLQTNERWLIKAHAADAIEAKNEGEPRLFQDLVEEVDAILWRADAETGRYTFVSRRAEGLVGFPVARWLDDGDFWVERVHPEDREWALVHRRKQIRDRADFEAEYRLIAADGHTIWFRESVRYIRGENGAPDTLCGLMVNISKRKKVERQLYTAKGELTMQLRDMVYLHDLRGRLAMTTDRASTLNEVLSAVTSLTGTDMAMIWLVDGPEMAASVGLPSDFAQHVGDGPGSFGEILGASRPLVIEDFRLDLDPDHARLVQAAEAGGFRALISVPLFARDGEPLGAIAACFRAENRPADRQVHLVERYAEQAADAIENARRLDEFQESERHLNQLHSLMTREMGPALVTVLNAAHSLPTLAARALIESQVSRMTQIVEDIHKSYHK